MRFECPFANSSGDELVVPVELSADEVENAGGVELYLHAFALRHAYKLVPPGFRHIANSVKEIRPH
jgi:hypothetical protein